MSKTMLYKPGAMIACGSHQLDYVIVDEDEIANHLASGWKRHPDEVLVGTPEPERKKPGRKPKAVEDGENKG
ncbi:Uncharacterised protein [Serratia entomophila]|uniref:hypothetical protein n=1 Tax=Serratia entomophila TaxID=42906 RepID=UPI00217BEB93|nr:hypothetical protein [Serratia entomophila]CAI1951796.1 Uncharacterised protein [Serratia entomophila]